MRTVPISCFLLIGALASPALAQPSPTPPPAGEPSPEPDGIQPTPLPPPSYSESAPDQPTPEGSAPPATAEPAAACLPTCRSGYACVVGECVSACNPACGPGEQCTSHGECSPAASGAHSQSFFDGSDEAPVAASRPGVEQHDGFLLRISVGASGGGSTLTAIKGTDADPAKIAYSGMGAAFAFDIGGSIANNLVLHGRFGYSAIESPNTTQDGEDLGSIEDLHVGVIFLGPAVAYYFMPINVYVTGAIGLSGIVVSEDGNSTPLTVSSGFGLNIDVGKEWWVSDNWGLGAVARFGYGTGGDKNQEYDVNFYSLALLFSATYQ